MECNSSLSVLFFGDSIATGQGVPALSSWPLLVGRVLQDKGGKAFVSAVNGETTRDALYRLEQNVLSIGEKLDVLYLQYGINDANFWQSSDGFPRVSPDAFRANLSEIVERVIGRGFQRVIIGTNHPVSKPLPEEAKVRFGFSDLRESVSRYNDLVREVAPHWSGCELFDPESSFRDESHLLSDGVHLSKKGHATYSRLFLSQLLNSG